MYVGGLKIGVNGRRVGRFFVAYLGVKKIFDTVKTIFELFKTLTDVFDIITDIPIGSFDDGVLPRASYIEARK
jgi:hypothetical protein